jgi:hypothetical protein
MGDVEPTGGSAESGDSSDEVVKSTLGESLESWDHVEPVEDVISASDSEGREFGARASRGASPDGKFLSSTLARPGETRTSKPKIAHGGDTLPASIEEEANPSTATPAIRLDADGQASGPAHEIEKRQQSGALIKQQPSSGTAIAASKRPSTASQVLSPPRGTARKATGQSAKPTTGKSQLEQLGLPKSSVGDVEEPATPSPSEPAAGMRASTSSGDTTT